MICVPTFVWVAVGFLAVAKSLRPLAWGLEDLSSFYRHQILRHFK